MSTIFFLQCVSVIIVCTDSGSDFFRLVRSAISVTFLSCDFLQEGLRLRSVNCSYVLYYTTSTIRCQDFLQKNSVWCDVCAKIGKIYVILWFSA